MSTVLFRVDGSSHLGMGHVMRCLAFAEGLRDRKIPSVFVTKVRERSVTDLIRMHGYEVESLSPQASDTEETESIRQIAGHRRATLIVTDICHRWALTQKPVLDAYHQQLQEAERVMALAGADVMDRPCDILVNPYVKSSYPTPPSNGKPMRLLGPAYFIFRREFSAAATTERSIAQKGQRILVTVGGGDELRFTVRIAKALCAIGTREMSLRIVLGPAYPQDLKAAVQAVLEDFPGESVLIDQASNMAEQFLWADLAVIGDGLTKYEAAVTGTPSLMLSRFDSEGELNQEFARTGTTIHVGDGAAIATGALAEQIQQLLNDVSRRTAMSQCGKALLDGRGLERILAAIPAEVIR